MAPHVLDAGGRAVAETSYSPSTAIGKSTSTIEVIAFDEQVQQSDVMGPMRARAESSSWRGEPGDLGELGEPGLSVAGSVSGRGGGHACSCTASVSSAPTPASSSWNTPIAPVPDGTGSSMCSSRGVPWARSAVSSAKRALTYSGHGLQIGRACWTQVIAAR